VNSGIQCTGNNANALVTVTNAVGSTLGAGQTISFSINNFNSPPTNQAVDAVTVTTYTSSSGAAIDQCTAYVSGLVAKTIPSSQFAIAEPNGNPIVVNSLNTLSFSITTVDIISYSDYLTITLPAGTALAGTFDPNALGGSIGINTATTSYSSPTLSVYFSGAGTLPAGYQLILIVPNFQAPASTAATAPFTASILSSTSFPKMTGTQTISASTGSLLGTATPTTPTVNVVTPYVFSITLSNALTASGSLTLTFPSVLAVASTSSCAVVTGNNLAVAPVCSFNALANSITLTALNSTASNIPAQNFSLTINSVTNPPSTHVTLAFAVVTYYSSAGGMVDSGSIPGVVASAGVINPATALVSASSLVNSETAVTYYLSFVVANPIPAGGFLVTNFPTKITFDTIAAAASCQLMVNSGTPTATSCTASLGSSYVFNFTNPLPATPAGAGTNLTLVVAASAVNPPSTQPFSPFSIYSYHSNGALIASLTNPLSFVTATPSTLTYRQFSRLSNTNAAVTTYTVDLIQVADL
jgi:hypothetical protein